MKTLLTATCLTGALALSGCGTPLWDANELNQVSPRFKTATTATQSVAASRPTAEEPAPVPERRPQAPAPVAQPTKSIAPPVRQASTSRADPAVESAARSASATQPTSVPPQPSRVASVSPDRTFAQPAEPVASALPREPAPRRATRFEIRNVILRAWNNMVPPAIDSIALFGIDPDVPPTFNAVAQPNATIASPPAQRSDRLDPADIRLQQRIDVPGL